MGYPQMSSALEHLEVVRDYLAQECSEGRVLGPFPVEDQQGRFGVIPNGKSGKWCLIINLSAPEGRSVNDGIELDLCSLSYVNVDEAAVVI